jgi:hypothetical protein
MKLMKYRAVEPTDRAQRNRHPFYAFRTWQGMTLFSWLRILVHNHFAVSVTRIPLAFRLSVHSVFSSIMSFMQDLIFAKRISAASLDEPPLFIIGHWRTGTTHLHNLISLDKRFITPTSLECFAPAHFLISSWLLRRLSFFLPGRRPTDDMFVDWDSPQEDEFALLNLGLCSPYETLMFPNNRPIWHEFLTMTGIAPTQLKKWKSEYLRFLQSVNYARGQKTKNSNGPVRIVLKSPPNTARLRILQQMFPDAQYIHMVRHPYYVFASTVLLWRTLYATQGLQRPQFGPLSNGAPDIEQYVLDNMNLLYHDFAEQTVKMPTHQICQVRYEDLIDDPIAEIDRIYRQLDLGESCSLRPLLESQLRKLDSYKPNTHQVAEDQKALIYKQWRWYLEQFGYAEP